MSTPIQPLQRIIPQLVRSNTRKRPLCQTCGRPSLRLLSTEASQEQSQPRRDLSEVANSPQSTEKPPRWSQTPPAMKAPVSISPKPEGWQPYQCNSDPAKLDAMYSRLLGRRGHQLLSTETKWLAVTHKSFDHGRRGFNDRLAFLGKRIVELQCSLMILARVDQMQPQQRSRYLSEKKDPHGRAVFEHPALMSINALNDMKTKDKLLDRHRVARVGRSYDVEKCIRWQPKNTHDLGASGATMVLAQAVYAIIGALSLEQGEPFASKVVRERILPKLEGSSAEV